MTDEHGARSQPGAKLRSPQLRVRVEGPDATLGRVPAADIARLILDLEKALARAASVTLGRPSRQPGRREEVVDQASNLRLRAVEPGSVVPVFDLPVADGIQSGFELDVAHLGEVAASQLLEVLNAKLDGHPYVVEALAQLGRHLGIGERYESVYFEVRESSAVDRPATFNRAVRQRLDERVKADRQAARQGMLLGTLVEADFEAFTARLRSPEGRAVAVSFDPSIADAIHEALREQASVEGWITYDPATHQAQSIALHTVRRADQLVLGVDPRAFRQQKAFSDLQREQGITGLFDVGELYDSESSEEDLNSYADALAAIA